MGIDYVYANHTKKQFFDVGLFGESCRSRHAGFGLGSRALSLLISERGSWNSDSIEMVDDITDKSLLISSEYTNISVEAELLILDIDGVDYFQEKIGYNFTMFSNLCLYAIILRRPEVIDLLDTIYGRGVWQKKYKNHYRGQQTGMEYAIYKAQARNIVLYRK